MSSAPIEVEKKSYDVNAAHFSVEPVLVISCPGEDSSVFVGLEAGTYDPMAPV